MKARLRISAAALIAATVAAGAAAAPARAADPLRIGTVKIAAAAPLFIAAARGYFAANGIDAKITYFVSPGPVPVAVASGAVDVASTGSSAELYTLAASGAFKIIASQAHEWPGFHMNALVVSKRAAAAGLDSFAAMPGHTVGVAEIGGPAQYGGAQLLEKHHIGLKAVRFEALQSNPNVLSAVIGGRVDSAVLPATNVVPAEQRGDLKILGWVGDDAPWQSSAVFARTKLLDSNPGLVRRFLAAYGKAMRDFHDAFTAPDGSRRDQATAPQILAILEKFTGQSEAQVRLGIVYVDPEARLDEADIKHQIAWFKAQHMLKPEVTLDKVLDSRFAVALTKP